MELVRNSIRDIGQYEKYRDIIGKSVGGLAEFWQMKFNNLEKFDFIRLDCRRRTE